METFDIITLLGTLIVALVCSYLIFSPLFKNKIDDRNS